MVHEYKSHEVQEDQCGDGVVEACQAVRTDERSH
jgi:hypothetical protein